MESPTESVPLTLGEFRIAAVLGRGGSGIVYDATWGPRRVALKVVHPDLASVPSVRAQFLAEAKRLQTITHAGVVKVLAVGELADGRPYLAMERLEGETLASVLARGPLPLDRALPMFGELCDAVAALHAQGLIHRDLKPENVFVVAVQHAVLLDFGIAKELAAPASTTTMDGGVRGTPAYMAPERFFGQPAGVATDIYELAVTLYAMLAGRLPWDDLADPEARLSPRALVDLVAVPSELDVEIRRALSTRAQNRPATATELREAVLAAAGAEAGAPAPADTARMRPANSSTPPPISGTQPTAGPQSSPQRPWFAERQPTTDRGRTPLAWAPTEAAPKQEPPQRRRWPVALAGVVVAGAAGGVAWWRLGGDDAPARAPAASAGPMIPAPPDAPPGTLAFSDDPWNKGPTPLPEAGPIPLTAPEVPQATARKELAAAIAHVPVDTQVLFTVIVGDLRRNQQYDAILDQVAKQPRVVELMTLLPCVKPIVSGSEWAIFAAKSLDEGHEGTLIVRGRWKRADVERCFAQQAEPRKMTDGETVLELPELGWVAFVDEHTVYLSVREDLTAAQVHELAKRGNGPTERTKKLLSGMPKSASITAVVDGFGMKWPDDALPKGSDATVWLRIESAATAFEVVADTHDARTASALVADVRPHFDEVFKPGTASIVGMINVVQDKTAMKISGRLTSLTISMIASRIP